MGYRATVIGGGLNLRAGMSTNSTYLTQIPSGTLIHVKDVGNATWIKAYYNYRLGYVMRQYLTEHTSQTSYGVEACERYGAALLQRGSTGNGVLVMQQDLRNYYFHSLATDGIFGSATEEAVMEYQEMSGLTADGLVGINTKISLYGDSVIG